MNDALNDDSLEELNKEVKKRDDDLLIDIVEKDEHETRVKTIAVLERIKRGHSIDLIE